MESQDKSFNMICRVCLNHENLSKMVSLIDTSQETGLSLYGSTLEDITKIPVKQNQYLPMNLCQKCKESLEGVSKFIKACRLSDKKLGKLIKFSLKQDLDGAMVKEVIRQYTLFSQNVSEVNNQNRTKTQGSKTEGTHTKIKVEVEVKAVGTVNCLDLESYENDDKYTILNDSNSSQLETDVDIFIHSIKKLITTSIEDIKTAKSNDSQTIKKRTDLKPETKIKPKSEQDLTCNICQKVLATVKTFKNHIQRHGVCRFVCDQCGKSFPINAELAQHQIHSHGASSQYECDICSYRAVKKIQLIEHMRLHTGERPFTCEKCGLTFRRKTLYNKHAKFHGERTIQCDCCPRKFFIRSAMLAHKNSRHNREYIYSCRICNVTYAMARTVKKHMLDKHGIPRHLQGKVQKTYKSDVVNSTFQKSEGELGDFTYL